MNKLAKIGDNHPPEQIAMDAIEAILENCEGVVVENDDQMKLVDDFIAECKAVEKQANADKETEFRPAKKISDDISKRFKPVLDICKQAIEDLNAKISPYKVKKAQEQAEQARIKRMILEEANIAAQAAEAMADMTDSESRRTADQLEAERREAERSLQATKKAAPKGLRTRDKVIITDPAAYFKWLQCDHKQDVLDWLQSDAEKRVRNGQRIMDGVKIEQEQYAR